MKRVVFIWVISDNPSGRILMGKFQMIMNKNIPFASLAGMLLVKDKFEVYNISQRKTWWQKLYFLKLKVFCRAF